MGRKTVFFCQEAPFITIGPGPSTGPDVVKFQDGYAELDRDDPRYDVKLGWIKSVSAYRIEELGDADTGRVLAGDDAQFPCPKCAEQGIDKAFSTKAALNGHLMSHRPKG